MAGKVEGNDAMAAGKRPQLAVPECPVGQAAVDEKKRRLARTGGGIDDLDPVRGGARFSFDFDRHVPSPVRKCSGGRCEYEKYSDKR